MAFSNGEIMDYLRSATHGKFCGGKKRGRVPLAMLTIGVDKPPTSKINLGEAARISSVVLRIRKPRFTEHVIEEDEHMILEYEV